VRRAAAGALAPGEELHLIAEIDSPFAGGRLQPMELGEEIALHLAAQEILTELGEGPGL